LERLLLGIKVLEQSDVAHYLLSRGVVKPREVIDDGFTVVDASRRNRVFLAGTRSGPTFVVKHGPALAHEAAILRLLAGAPGLAEHVPAVVLEEPACLVLRTPGGAQAWRDGGRLPARMLGRTLAELHRLPVDAPRAPPPWALALAEPPHDLVRELSAAAQDVVARVQSSAFVCRRLDELRAAEGDGALVHGDLRWDNCLALPAPGARRHTRVLLVDWESAGRADAAFDVGSVVAEYLRAWVGSVPMVDDAEPARLVDRARLPLASLRPVVHAFWTAYRDAMPGAPEPRRIAELAAVRLMQTAVEVARGLSETTAHVVTLLQLADNMLRRPEVAAEGLLGLRA
jgi:Phosphotransferase enzyme family